MQETNSPAVAFDNVSLQIGNKNILTNISLTIPANSITGILGPNGAGKSSLISLIIGLESQTSGTITILGQMLPAKGESLRQRIGVVLQETSLYEELTVTENLLFFASLYNVEHPKNKVAEVLELLGLLDRAKDPIHILSGGLKRRITIARSLLHDPEFLVIDEPTLGVDVETRHIIWEHLRYLRSKGHTILIASNYLDEVQAICDNVSVLRNGKLLITDSPNTLIAKTGHSLDIDCDQQSAEKISQALSENDDVIRSEVTMSGITIFLKGATIPDKIVNIVLKTAPVDGFRFRPADLAEVFESLEEANILDTTTKELTSKVQTKNIFTRYPILVTLSLILILCSVLLAEIWLSQPR